MKPYYNRAPVERWVIHFFREPIVKLIDTSEKQELEIIATNAETFLVSITGFDERIGAGLFLTKEQAKKLSDYICTALEQYNAKLTGIAHERSSE